MKNLKHSAQKIGFKPIRAVKGPMLWNCLPKHVKGALTLSAFKGLLGDFLNQIPDMPPSTGYNGVNHNSILDWAKQITESDFACLYKGVPIKKDCRSEPC